MFQLFAIIPGSFENKWKPLNYVVFKSDTDNILVTSDFLHEINKIEFL